MWQRLEQAWPWAKPGWGQDLWSEIQPGAGSSPVKMGGTHHSRRRKEQSHTQGAPQKKMSSVAGHWGRERIGSSEIRGVDRAGPWNLGFVQFYQRTRSELYSQRCENTCCAGNRYILLQRFGPPLVIFQGQWNHSEITGLSLSYPD